PKDPADPVSGPNDGSPSDSSNNDDNYGGKTSNQDKNGATVQSDSALPSLGFDPKPKDPVDIVPGPSDMSVYNKNSSIGSLEGTTVTARPPYYCHLAATAASAKALITRGIFSPETPRMNPGRYEAFPGDATQIQPVAIVKKAPDQGDWILCQKNGIDAISGPGTMALRSDWRQPVETVYYFDTVTNKPMAVVYKCVADERFRILNADMLIKTTYKNAPFHQPPRSAPKPSISQISTRKAAITPQNRAYTGWSTLAVGQAREPVHETVHV
ncbi:MAG: hypothetical protein L6R41_008451, partial [Letrouitia leprolyta]